MFGMGMPEIMLILAVALIVIGPKKLPGLAKSIGRAMGEFKSASRDFKRSIDLDGDLQDVKDSMNGLKDIPTYDPDQSAYTQEDPSYSTGDTPEETETSSDPAEPVETAQPSTGPEAEASPSSGAKPNG